jgi:hypothetical protein
MIHTIPFNYRRKPTLKHEKGPWEFEKELWNFTPDEIDDPGHDMASALQSPEDAGIAPPATAPLTSSAGIPKNASPARTSAPRSASFHKNPWVIHSPLDACRFFGPLLSLIVVTQICASILISRQLEGSITEMTFTSIAAIIMAAFLLADASVLIHLRGHHFKKLIPWLTGLLLICITICLGLYFWKQIPF